VKKNYHNAVEEPLGLWTRRYPPPYFLEQKIDGTRVFCFKGQVDGITKFLMATKHNGVYSQADYPETIADLARATAGVRDCILDAELDWHVKPEVLYVYDILSVNALDIRGQKLSRRKEILASLFKEQRLVKIVPFRLVTTQGEILDEKAERVERGEEGVMVKADVPYTTTGNSWLKVKGTIELDAAVTDIKESDGFLEDGTPWTVNIHVYDEKGQPFPIGSVSSCVKGVNRRDLVPGAVLRLKCYKVFPSYRLRHPTILEIRKDKLPEECSITQLQQHIKIAEPAGLKTG
jgi:ATP dependent DNA ligase domain